MNEEEIRLTKEEITILHHGLEVMKEEEHLGDIMRHLEEKIVKVMENTIRNIYALEEAINSKAKKLEKDMIMRQINIDIEKLREEMRRLKRARRRFFKEFEEEDESQQTEVHKIQRILHKIKNLEDIAKKLELRANIK